MWLVVWTLGAALAGRAEVVTALSAHDPVSCAEVASLTATPLADLQYVIEKVRRPAWAAMRAADCVVRQHGREVPDTLSSWVRDQDRPGLGRLVLGRLDLLDEDQAVALARIALDSGPEPERARKLVRRARSARVRAVATLAPQSAD